MSIFRERYEKVKVLAGRGATEGERDAAREAMALNPGQQAADLGIPSRPAPLGTVMGRAGGTGCAEAGRPEAAEAVKESKMNLDSARGTAIVGLLVSIALTLIIGVIFFVATTETDGFIKLISNFGLGISAGLLILSVAKDLGR